MAPGEPDAARATCARAAGGRFERFANRAAVAGRPLRPLAIIGVDPRRRGRRAIVEAEQGPRACAGMRPETSAGPASATPRIGRPVHCLPLADAATPGRPPWTVDAMRCVECRPPAGIANVRADPHGSAMGRSARRSRGPALARGCDPRRAQGRRTRRSEPARPLEAGPRRARDSGAASLDGRRDAMRGVSAASGDRRRARRSPWLRHGAPRRARDPGAASLDGRRDAMRGVSAASGDRKRARRSPWLRHGAPRRARDPAT